MDDIGFQIDPGAEFNVRFELKNPDNSAVDLTGVTGEITIANKEGCLSFPVQITPLIGRIDVHFSSTETSNLLPSSGYRFKCDMTLPSGAVRRVISGFFLVTRSFCP